MPYIPEPALLAFKEELHKTADWKQRALGAAGGTGLGAIAGAGVGAVRGAYKAHQQGESMTQGALAGGKQGLGVGALGGAALGGALPNAVHAIAQSNNVAGSVARSGMRQLHAVSGLTPKGGIDVLRGNAYQARQALAAAAPEHVGHAAKALKASEAAEGMGLTNLPGYLGAIKQHGLGKVLKTDAAAQWHSGGVGHKALSIGLPALGVASDLKAKETEGGPGKGEMIGKGVAGAAGSMLGSAMPLSGQLLLGSGLSAAGGLVGRGVDKMRKRKQPAALGQLASTEQHGQHTPVERIMSPGALGQPPEGMMA